MMKNQKPFKRNRLWIYLVVIGAIAYFFTKNSIDVSQLQAIKWTGRIGVAIVLGIAMLLLRDFGYVMRMRLMTDNEIPFWQTVRIILLWEFGSAITPGMIGGKAVAVFLLIKNKISGARASAIVLLSILLDEFIFVLLFPIFYFIIGPSMLHGDPNCQDWLSLRARMPFIDNVRYLEEAIVMMLIFIMSFVIITFVGIFLKPLWIQSRIIALSRWRIFHRWKENIRNFAEELRSTSQEMKSKNSKFWIPLIGYTLLSWIGRYLIGVAIVWGFANDSFDFIPVYTKQYALWLMFYLPSTPGSSGIAEALYMAFYCEYIQTGMSGAAALVWRFLSYYIYLIIGFALLGFSGEGKDIEEK